jgi:hypothetical protein
MVPKIAGLRAIERKLRTRVAELGYPHRRSNAFPKGVLLESLASKP